MKIDLKELLGRAFDAGFYRSAQGYNGEYPFYSDKHRIHRELTDARNDAIDEILSTVEPHQ